MPEIEQFRDPEQKTLLRDLDIPAVRDRSPDPTAGPRLAVSEFRIQGLVEYPELGITREALAQLVEGIRFDLMAEGKLLESGYTIEELGELSDLLVEIEEETLDRHVTPLEVQKLVWLIREQRGKRGVTLGMIETVANKITQFYRERGFILAKAYIPKQRVRDGVVNLTLLLGMLGEVAVNGNEMYDASTLQGVFADQLGQPVTNQAIEENLFIINSFPGITVDGYFEPGYQVGDTRLNINVKSESRYNANLRLDNHGTDESGLYRLYADVQVNNLFGIADYFHASVLEAAEPSNTTYWQLDYESNFISPRFRLGLEASQNQFVVDQSAIATNIDLNGIVDVLALTGEYISQRGRTENASYELRYESIKSDLQIGSLPDFGNALDEELTQVSLKYNYDFLDDQNKRLHEGNIKYTNG
ncbi:MAG: POTRA domain-containing protein, partial [Thioalkalispiraceae bacterium]